MCLICVIKNYQGFLLISLIWIFLTYFFILNSSHHILGFSWKKNPHIIFQINSKFFKKKYLKFVKRKHFCQIKVASQSFQSAISYVTKSLPKSLTKKNISWKTEISSWQFINKYSHFIHNRFIDIFAYFFLSTTTREREKSEWVSEWVKERKNDDDSLQRTIKWTFKKSSKALSHRFSVTFYFLISSNIIAVSCLVFVISLHHIDEYKLLLTLSDVGSFILCVFSFLAREIVVKSS